MFVKLKAHSIRDAVVCPRWHQGLVTLRQGDTNEGHKYSVGRSMSMSMRIGTFESRLIRSADAAFRRRAMVGNKLWRVSQGRTNSNQFRQVSTLPEASGPGIIQIHVILCANASALSNGW